MQTSTPETAVSFYVSFQIIHCIVLFYLFMRIGAGTELAKPLDI